MIFHLSFDTFHWSFPGPYFVMLSVTSWSACLAERQRAIHEITRKNTSNRWQMGMRNGKWLAPSSLTKQ
jgi:hypothetical protein